MDKMEKVEGVVKLVTYRYLFKGKGVEGDNFGVKVVTDTPDAIDRFDASIYSNSDVDVCFREYVGEIDCSLIGAVVPVKGCSPSTSTVEEVQNEEV